MSRSDQKQLTRQRILDAAGRSFRKGGFGGTGVDGVAKEAGVTSGAFYVHFNSKALAFREAMDKGMDDLKKGIQLFQAQHGDQWWPAFVRFYLGEKRQCDLADSCALQSLAPEVARADDEARAAFSAALVSVAQVLASGQHKALAPIDIDAALAALATLAGAVTLSRAVSDPHLADRIAQATEKALTPLLTGRL